MANKPQYKKEDWVQAIKNSQGIKSVIHDRLGSDYKTLMRYIEKYPELQELIDDEKRKMDDFAESKIYKLIKEEDRTMIIFYAKTKMKNRGYAERTELTGKDGGSIKTEHTPDQESAALYAEALGRSLEDKR